MSIPVGIVSNQQLYIVSNSIKKDIASLAELRTLHHHTRFATLNRQVSKVVNDVGKILFDKAMRGETRSLENNQEALFDISEKISGES